MKVLQCIGITAHHILVSLRIWKYFKRFKELIVPNEYEWPYLKETATRGEILFNIIKPHLRSGDSFLDINCGYSPLAGPLLRSNYRIAGFDVSTDPIKYLRKHLPEGEWHQTSYENALMRGFSVLIFLGAGGIDEVPNFPFQKYLLNLLELNNPRLILLETCNGYSGDIRFFKKILRLFMNKNYELLDKGEYDAKFQVSKVNGIEKSIRRYAIMGRSSGSRFV